MSDNEFHRRDYESCPRYDKHELTDAQMEEIATRAAMRALGIAENRLYQTIGKRVVGFVFWVVGIASVALFVLAIKMGWVKP